MTATSNNPAASVVYVTSQAISGNTVTTEQGSGVLIAPDEVLTAAHILYDGTGHIYSDVRVSAGYGGGAVYGTSAAQAVHAMPDADWTQLSNAGSDFAVIHLATPITDVPVMALGSDFAGGAVTVTGYPQATSGLQDSQPETVGAVPGYDGVLQGAVLGASGDAHGASGGPVWTSSGGAATVVGLTQSEAGSTGYFLRLTAADVAQIASWMGQDQAEDAVARQQAASASPATADLAATTAATVSPTVAASTGTTAADAVTFMSGEAAVIPAIAGHGYIDRATSRVVALLTQDAAALGATAGFQGVASDALSQLGDNSQARNLAASLLEGVIWGYGGGDAGSVIAGVAAQDTNIVNHQGSIHAAQAGAVLGQALLTSGF